MQPALTLYDDDKDSFWAAAAEEGATDAMVKYGVGIIEEGKARQDEGGETKKREEIGRKGRRKERNETKEGQKE